MTRKGFFSVIAAAPLAAIGILRPGWGISRRYHGGLEGLVSSLRQLTIRGHTTSVSLREFTQAARPFSDAEGGAR